MPYVINENCTKDMLCVDGCPAGAIHEAEAKGDSELAPSLYINPDECMECGSCEAVCVSDAVQWEADLPSPK